MLSLRIMLRGPTRTSKAICGSRHDIASNSTVGKASVKLDIQYTFDLYIRCKTSWLDFCPNSVTELPIPNSIILFSKLFLSGPSPTMKSLILQSDNERATFQISSNLRNPFSDDSLPTAIAILSLGFILLHSIFIEEIKLGTVISFVCLL